MVDQQRRTLAGMGAALLLLHTVGWGGLLWASAAHPHGRTTVGLGLGLTAYTLGLRHAFDADHIAAIDNTTRKLRGDGRPAPAVGFFFSLGHSSVVFVLAAALALGVHGAGAAVRSSSSTLHTVTGVIGPTVSGVFLLAMAATNAVTGRAMWRAWAVRHTPHAQLAFDEARARRGLVARVLAGPASRVERDWHMLGLGFLFGLGFDTATEVALLAVAGAGAASGLPWFVVLLLPVLFAAGMCLLDTADGVAMTVAYGRSAATPWRAAGVNLAMVGVSVAFAVVIGSVELAGVMSEQGVSLGPVRWVAGLGIDDLGYALCAALVVVAGTAAALTRPTKTPLATLAETR